MTAASSGVYAVGRPFCEAVMIHFLRERCCRFLERHEPRFGSCNPSAFEHMPTPVEIQHSFATIDADPHMVEQDVFHGEAAERDVREIVATFGNHSTLESKRLSFVQAMFDDPLNQLQPIIMDRFDARILGGVRYPTLAGFLRMLLNTPPTSLADIEDGAIARVDQFVDVEVIWHNLFYQRGLLAAIPIALIHHSCEFLMPGIF